MTKKIIFQDSFLISGIMCHKGCGASIQAVLRDLDTFKQKQLLPQDAQIIIDAEPQTLGIHRLLLLIETEDEQFSLEALGMEEVTAQLRKNLTDLGFKIETEEEEGPEKGWQAFNWINIALNLVALLAIIALSFIFPPSLFLTIGLTALTVLVTAFTARRYLLDFLRNLRHLNLANMATTITLGWLFSLAHTFYHSITMPLASSFSMTFMSFMMPVMLITIINGMDEIKRLVLSRSKKMHLKGMNALFPQMAKKYRGFQLSESQQLRIDAMIKACKADNGEDKTGPYLLLEEEINTFLMDSQAIKQNRALLRKGMIITIKRGACFPVDGLIIQGNTFVDTSVLTGETQQNKQLLDFIPAGAINLGQEVSIYALEDGYNSTINKILFPSNRAEKKKDDLTNRQFIYIYTALIILGIAASIAVPFGFGIFLIPLMLQNLAGILFTICPCTIAIAHQLPTLFSIYQRSKKGIIMRSDGMSGGFEDLHTIVFDKTGTLTNGKSQVDSCEGISPALWERIYLLEKHHGSDHPLGRAIIKHYEKNGRTQGIFNHIDKVSIDSKNRGISGMVQDKQIHIGNLDYLKESKVRFLNDPSAEADVRLAQGYTPIYIAENNSYQGVIYVKHEMRKEILDSLLRLKQAGKKLIMLTGDSALSASGFNQQNGSIFDEDAIEAQQTPSKKEEFLERLMARPDARPEGNCYVCDGVNDLLAVRAGNDKGMLTCAMTDDDKSAMFTDISLNGSLDYLLQHNKINRFSKKTIRQNQFLLTYSAVAFLVFIISFSVLGIAVSPLIPMLIMASTTVFILFNSYRVSLAIDTVMDKNPGLIKQFLASDLSIGLLMSISTLLLFGILLSSIATGGLALPVIAFTAGTVTAIASACLLTACLLIAIAVVITSGCVFMDKCFPKNSGEADGTNYFPEETCSNDGLDAAIDHNTTTSLFFRQQGSEVADKESLPEDNSALLPFKI